MRNFTLTHIILYLLISVSSVYANSLLGKWVAKSPQNSSYLEFVSDSTLIYNNEQLSYMIVGDKIRVAADYGYVDYPYTLDDKTLRISFPEGYQLLFKRQKKVDYSSSENRYLRGRLCSFSTSYNGGYSTNSWVEFDGIGRFRTNSSSSYSGENGSYYGQGDDGSGTYSLHGDNISLRANDGSLYQGYVIERQNSGVVTGIKINSKVYASAVCD